MPDDPPPEILAVGHDRCIITLRRNNLDAWLRPDRADLAVQYANLDDRKRPYYEHRLAAPAFRTSPFVRPTVAQGVADVSYLLSGNWRCRNSLQPLSFCTAPDSSSSQ